MNRIPLFIIFLTQSVFANDLPHWKLEFKHLDKETQKIVQASQLEPTGLTLKEIDLLIKKIQAQPQIESVQVEENSIGNAVLIPTYSHKVTRINIVGLRNLGLSDAKNLLGISTGDLFNQELLSEGGERIRSALRDLGFLGPVLEIEYPSDKEGNVDILVKVKEGLQTNIRQILIQSPDPTLNRILEKKFEKFSGQSYTEKNIRELFEYLNQYLQDNHHIRAEIVGPEANFSANDEFADLSFKIEKVEKWSVDLNGVTAFSVFYLDKKIIDLSNFRSTNPNLIAEFSDRVRNYYLENGYARVEVKAEEKSDSTEFQKNIQIDIIEGPKVRIENIQVNGSISKKPEWYADFIQTHSSSLLKNGFYNKDDLEKGLSQLITELQNQGYLVAKVISSRTSYTKDKNKIQIFVNIEEGPQTQVGRINFYGNSSFTKEQLLTALELNTTGPLFLDRLENAIYRLKEFYRSRGYIEFELMNEKQDLVVYNDDNTQADIQFKMSEGPRVTVGSIILDGNRFTKDYVLINELDFEIGDTLTPEKISESVLRLQRSGHFNSVEIKTLEEKTPVEKRTVIVRVSERNPGVFTMGIGATNERSLTLRGYTGVAYHNIEGTGRGASARIDGNYNIADIKFFERKLTLGYLEPYLFNSRIRGRANASRSIGVTDYDLRQVSEVNQTTLSLERDFNSNITGIWDVYSLATVSDFTLDKPSEKTVLDIATTGPTLEFDYRDSPYNPTKGTFSRINFEYADPDSLRSSQTIHYWRATASSTHYHQFKDSQIVWANSLRFGYLSNLSTLTDGGVPYDKKGFVLGGRSTIRGYEAGTQEVFPNATDLNSTKFLLKTNARMGLIKSELRFPFWGQFEWAVFYDGGLVEIDGLSLTENYKDSTGFGIRFQTPVGPFSLDWGWKLRRRAGEDPWRFHLSMGTF